MTRQRNQEEKRLIDLEKTQRDIEKENEFKQRQLEDRRKELEFNRFNNQKANDRVEALRQELRALEKHQDTLNGQNKQLLSEMESFAHQDENIKHKLDRKGHVSQMKETLYAQERLSARKVIEASPERRRKAMAESISVRQF